MPNMLQIFQVLSSAPKHMSCVLILYSSKLSQAAGVLEVGFAFAELNHRILEDLTCQETNRFSTRTIPPDCNQTFLSQRLER